MTYIFRNTQDLIHALYSKAGITIPTHDMYLFAEALNIRCYESTDNRALYFDNQNYIFINRDLNNRQKWEAFGHELGHVMLHWGKQCNISKEVRHQQEIEADRFSLYFCIPSFLLNVMQLDNHIGYAAEQVSEIFGVTLPFAHKRLELFIKERSNQYVLQKT